MHSLSRSLLIILALNTSACSPYAEYNSESGHSNILIDDSNWTFELTTVGDDVKTKRGRFYNCSNVDFICIDGDPFFFKTSRRDFTERSNSARTWRVRSDDAGRICDFELDGSKVVAFECMRTNDSPSIPYYHAIFSISGPIDLEKIPNSPN